MKYRIRRDSDRYGDMGDELECVIAVEGTLPQAEKIAELLSYNWPGCDSLFYVQEDE